MLSHRERCVERCCNATNGKIRTIYILMMYSHCRVAARKATMAAIIARIGYVSNLTDYTHKDLIVWKKTGFIACSVNNQSRRFIASRKTCIAASSHRVYVKGPLETCPMRAIIAAIVSSRATTRQCEYIIKIYSVLIGLLRKMQIFGTFTITAFSLLSLYSSQ